MTKVLKELIDGTVAEFDTDLYSPEVIDRYVADFNSKYKPPSPVPTGETSAPSVTGLPNIDPSELDTGLTWLGKQAGAALQGTGRGFAGLGDIAMSGINAANTAVTNPVRQLLGMEQKTAGFEWPLTETYDKYAPAAPLGYEETAGWSEMLGPIAATEILSGGAATPAALGAMRGASFLPKLAKAATTSVGWPLVKTPFIAGTGIVGGEFGGKVGKALGGDNGEVLGTLLGGAIAPSGAVPAAKVLANKLTMDASSAGKLALLKRQGIKPTFGDVGMKGISTLQDVTGRGIFGGSPAFDARADLYRRVEQAIIDNVATVRGRSSGVPEPSTGQITKESIGGEAAYAAKIGIAEAERLKKEIQTELLRDIGPDTSVDPTPFYDRMDNLFSKIHDDKLRDQLRTIVADFDRNIPAPSSYTPPLIDPFTGVPVKGTARGTVSTNQPDYAAVQQRSSDVGRTVDSTGRGYNKGFTKEAYGGMRDAMEETAQKQGVTDFGPRQDATEQLYRDIEGMEPTAEASGAGAAFDSLFSGTNKQSIEQLYPFRRHAPADTARVLANLLDWKLRGAGRAGIEGTDPTALPMQQVETAITKANPEHMIAMTGGSPEVLSNLKDIGQIAHNENIRPGKRTVPGGVGSTIGTLALPGLGTIGGLIHGLAANPGALGGDLGALLMAAISPMAGFAAGEAGTYGLGKLLTNPRLTEAIARPVYPTPATSVRRAAQGVSVEAAHKNQKGKADEDQSLEEELGRRYVK